MNRRGFIGAAAATASFGLTACATARSHSALEATPDVAAKFYANGRVHPFPGATIVCHIDQQGPNAAYFNALLDIYRDTPDYAFTRKVAMLPPSSYHVTLFDLVTEVSRTDERWPDGLPLDAPMEVCAAFLAEKLSKFRLETPPRFVMRIVPFEPVVKERTLAIRLEPASAEEHARIRTLRDRLSDAVGICAPNHDAYGFHTTLGYFLEWLTPAELVECRRAMRMWQGRVSSAAPEIVLGAPEYCTFRDMFAFNRKFFLE